MALDFGVGYFGDSDRAVLRKVFILDLAVKEYLFCLYIFSVDMSEDSDVLRTIFERKGYGECITIRSQKVSVLCDKVETAALFDGCELVVDEVIYTSKRIL